MVSGAISSRSPVTIKHMEEKTKTTNVDHCRYYRKKNAEEYKVIDVLRQKRA